LTDSPILCTITPSLLVSHLPITMIHKRRPYLAILLSAVYVSETLVGVAHHHSGRGCAHSRRTEHRVSAHRVSADAYAARTHACPCSHEKVESRSPQDSAPAREPSHDEDNCPVCKFLAQRSLGVDWGIPPHISDPVRLFCPGRPVLHVGSCHLSYYSRGPPA
jgi:hypothetical protein